MKPRIRPYVDFPGWYECYGPMCDGFLGRGYGRTIAQAYRDWKTNEIPF